MFALDLERHKILHDAELKRELAEGKSWKSWIRVSGFRSQESVADRLPIPDSRILELQRAFGYTNEDLRVVLRPMGAEGLDAVWSMGDDTPVAPFARAPRPLYAFFRQRFAQVTNPPIDPLRESLVMSLHTWLGPRPDLLQVDGPRQEMIELPSSIIDAATLAAIRTQSVLRTSELEATFPAQADPRALETAIDELCQTAEMAVRTGAQLCSLSDRGVSPATAPIPMLLAVGG